MKKESQIQQNIKEEQAVLLGSWYGGQWVEWGRLISAIGNIAGAAFDYINSLLYMYVLCVCVYLRLMVLWLLGGRLSSYKKIFRIRKQIFDKLN